MRRVVLCLALFSASCTVWQGTKSDRSSDWTWVCGGGDDDDSSSSMRAPDSGCPMDAGDDDDDGGT